MEIFSTAPRLDNEDDWPRWIAYIQRVSEDLGIWYLVDPDADDDLVERLLEATRPPTGEIAIKEVMADHQKTYDAELQQYNA